MKTGATPNFNPVARPYRWLEYLALGPILQRTRVFFLPQLRDRRQALLLGDGDGRFLARLLQQNPLLQAEAVDASALMLHLLLQRAGTSHARVQTHHEDARTYTPATSPDLIVTHFFLDCLTQPELDRLVHQLAPSLAPRGLWLVSDFRIPGGALRLPAFLYVRVLYLAFRLLTGLRTTHLPDHTTALRRAGLTCVAQHRPLFGMLTTELWQAPAAQPSGSRGTSAAVFP